MLFKFDREYKVSYILNVEVCDGGKLFKFVFVDVKIMIFDINDNKLLFDKLFYFVCVNEDVIIGILVIIVFVKDDDVGRNSEIIYVIKSGNE